MGFLKNLTNKVAAAAAPKPSDKTKDLKAEMQKDPVNPINVRNLKKGETTLSEAEKILGGKPVETQKLGVGGDFISIWRNKETEYQISLSFNKSNVLQQIATRTKK